MSLEDTMNGMYFTMKEQGHDLDNGSYVFYISSDLAENAPKDYNNLPVIVAGIMPPSHVSLTVRNLEFEAVVPQ